MKIKKKRIAIFFAIFVFAVLLYLPIYHYVQTLKIYYKFQSRIQIDSDPIFRTGMKPLSYNPQEFNETGRLFYLCKVWGFLKYYLEFENSRPQNIDSILVKSIPLAIEARDIKTFQGVIDNLIISIQENSLKGGTNPYPDIKKYNLIDNDWMQDSICLNSDIQQKLENIFYSHTGKRNQFIHNKLTVGTIRLTNEPEYLTFPDETIRLVGLFRYWNTINYFYTYKNYLDKSWDQVLYEAIPCFRIADTDATYRQSIYRLTNELRDTHASYPPTIDTCVFGRYRPNFRMMCIDDTFVISKIRVPQLPSRDFQVGDIVLKVDNNDIRNLYDSSLQYVCGGNKWSNQSFGCNAVLSRSDTTTVFTLLRKNDTITVKSRNYTAYDLFQQEGNNEKQNRKSKLYEWVNDSIAYFNLQSATPTNFNKNYKPIQSAAVIILDLRCYPNGLLISNLTNAFVPPDSFFAYTTYPDTRFPGLVRYCRSTSQKIGNKNYFKGHVIVLVNELTASYTEYTAMGLQANPKTITVGNSTSGADGNVTFFEFPGKVTTTFSGIGIYYPDLTPTQRIGVRIDYVAEPTIESIKNNIDIAYEQAVLIAKSGFCKVLYNKL